MKKIHPFVAGLVTLLLSVAIHAGTIATATLNIQGMDCASCPLTVKAVLKRVAGVSAVSIDYETHSAEVKFDPGKTRPEQLAKVVSDSGFPTTLKK